jgi:hypothetical protein
VYVVTLEPEPEDALRSIVDGRGWFRMARNPFQIIDNMKALIGS